MLFSVALDTGKAIYSALREWLRFPTCIIGAALLLGGNGELLCAESPRKETARLGIAVLDFRQRTLSPRVESFRRTLTEGLIERLGVIQGVYVVEREALDPFMGELSFSESGAVDPLTMQRFGRALSADLLIEGSIFARQGVLVIDYRGHEVRTSRIAFRGSIETHEPNARQVAEKVVSEVERWKRTVTPIDGAKDTVHRGLPSLAIFDFQHPSDPLMGLTVRSLMASAALRLSGVSVVERENIDALLRELRFQQSGLVDPKTRLRLGRLLGATWIIYGEVEDVGTEGILLSVKAAETETGQILLARQLKGRREDIPSYQEGFIRELAGVLNAGLTRNSRDSQEESRVFLSRSEQGPRGVLWKGPERGMLKQVDDLKRAIFLDPFSAKSYVALCEVLENMYRYDDARTVLLSLILRVPSTRLAPGELGRAYFKLGVLDQKLGEHESAVKHLRMGIAAGGIGHLADNSRLFIGRSLALLGRDQEAIEAYRSVEAPDTTRTCMEIAYHLERLGRIDEAIPLYEAEARRTAQYGYEPTGFAHINPVDRIDLLERIRNAPQAPYRLLLEAELETRRHEWASQSGNDRFLKDNFDILNRTLPEDRIEAYRAAHLTDHLTKAIAILERLLRENPKHPVVPDALWLLAGCHQQRRFADYRLDISSVVVPLYMRIADDYPKHCAAERSLALASSFAKTPAGKAQLLRRRIENPKTSLKDRQLAILTLAHLEKNEFKNRDKALELYQRFLGQRKWMEQQGGTWLHWIKEAEGGIRVISTGSYLRPLEDSVRECIGRADFICAGLTFQNPPRLKFEEAAWAYWAGFRFGKSEERKSDALWWFAQTLERLRIPSEAMRRYQQLIDLYLESRGDLAEQSQKRIDALLSQTGNLAEDSRRYAELERKFADLDKQYLGLPPRRAVETAPRKDLKAVRR